MNILYNNWQAIDLNNFNSVLGNGAANSLATLESSFFYFDPYASPLSQSNTQIVGIGYVVNGNHLIDTYPIKSIYYIGLDNGLASFQIYSNVSINFNTDAFGGYFTNFNYHAYSPALGAASDVQLSGVFYLDAVGNLAGGAATSINIAVDGYYASIRGSFTLNALGEFTGGTTTGFTLADNLGHALDVSGISISYSVFDNLTDPLFGHTTLTDLYSLITSTTSLSGNDAIIADDLDNNINGYAGNDNLYGVAGNDTLDGGSGVDSMTGGLGDDIYIVDNTADRVVELTAEGTDVVKASSSFTLGDNIENLTLTGTANINGAGNAANNVLTGNAGNNIIDGGLGLDTLIGGLGNDTYVIDSLSDVVTEGANEGSDTVQVNFTYTLGITNVENLTLIGTAAINGTGDANDNVITGNSASNTLNGGLGNDTLDGGASSVYNPGVIDTLNGDAGNDTFLSRGFYGAGSYNGGADIDTLDFGQADAYTAGRRATEKAGVKVDLNLGNASVYYVRASNFTWADANGQIALSGIENVRGTTQSDIITGDANANVLDGGVSDVYNPGVIDVLNGGDGDDTFLVRGFFGAGNYTGGGGIDTLDFSQADAYTAGRRTAEGAGVHVNLGLNNAAVYYNKLANIYFGANSTWADANGQIAVNGIENVRGTAQADILIGDANANLLEGSAGDDTLNGGLGLDTLIGGLGNDTYVLDAIGASSFDVISGFISGQDKISLSGVTFSPALTAGIYTDMFVLGTAAQDVNDYIIYNQATGELFFDADANGAGSKELIAKLDPNTNLLQSDFINALASPTPTQNQTITGTALNDSLTGSAGKDTINGLAGDDILNGGAGADTMTGGLGNDVFYVDNANDIAIEDFFYFNQANGFYYENGHYELGYIGQHPNNINTIYSSVSYTADFGIGNLTLTGTANINAYGSNYKSNVITGNSGDNILDGGVNTNPELNALASSGTHIFFGNLDTLIGGAGNDTYIIRNAETVIELAGEGIDTYILSGEGGPFPVAFLIDPSSEIENFILANDNVLIDYISGTNKDNLIIGNNLTNYISGLAGNDELKGLGGNDTLAGNGGNDTLWGGTGNDTFYFDAAGINAYDIVKDFASGQDKIVISSASGLLYTTPLLSGIYTDMFVSASGASAVAQDSNDYIIYNKATGDLFYDYDGNGANVQQIIANFLPNTNLLQSDFVGALNSTQPPVTPVVIDQLITGSAFSDSLASGAGNDTINAGAGNDTLNGGDGNDKLNGEADNDTLYGMGGNDTLNGGDGNNTLFGGDGNDLLFVANNIFTSNGDNYFDGGLGVDTMSGGFGADVYVVDNIGDIIGENSGYVTGSLNLVYSSVTYTTRANIDLVLTGTDNIYAFVASNFNPDMNYRGYVSVTGNSGNNYIEGALNFVSTTSRTYDLLKGGAGNDTYIVDSDVIVELSNEGIDTAIFADFNGASTFSGTYTIEANVENVDFSQYLSNRNIFGTGNSLDNIITGSRNVDVLNGMTGNDTLIGGENADQLTGGIGSDVFKFNAISEFQDTLNPLNRDVITDFSHIELDKIDFAVIDANSNVTGDQAFNFIGNDVAFSNIAGQLRFVSAINSLFGDVNGDGVADFQIALTGVTSLTAGDFIL